MDLIINAVMALILTLSSGVVIGLSLKEMVENLKKKAYIKCGLSISIIIFMTALTIVGAIHI